MVDSLEDLLAYHRLRQIIAMCAHSLDRRRFDDWLAICTDDVVMIVPADPARPPSIARGKAEFRTFLEVVARYEATTHFTGNTLAQIEKDRATTETYCMANHISSEAGTQTNLRAAVRYLDSFVKLDGQWLMKQRQLVIDWYEVTESSTVAFDMENR